LPYHGNKGAKGRLAGEGTRCLPVAGQPGASRQKRKSGWICQATGDLGRKGVPRQEPGNEVKRR